MAASVFTSLIFGTNGGMGANKPICSNKTENNRAECYVCTLYNASQSIWEEEDLVLTFGPGERSEHPISFELGTLYRRRSQRNLDMPGSHIDWINCQS